MILDVTTNNTVYNTIGLQAKWFAHRWGKRSYPSLDLELSDIPASPIYHLACVYGDPADWKYIDDFLLTTNQTVFLDTYGMFTTSTLELLKDVSVGFVHLHVDGWNTTMGKVYLGQQLDSVKDTVFALPASTTLIYSVYQHNVCDIPEFIEFCEKHNIKYKIKPGDITDNGLSCIVNQDSEWLYDIWAAPTDDLEAMDFSQHTPLYKSTTGGQRLVTFMRPPEGRSIIDKPLLPNLSTLDISQEIKNKFTDGDPCFVSTNGIVFSNCALGQLFMALLGTDWKFTVLDLPHLDDYLKEVVYGASLIKDLLA